VDINCHAGAVRIFADRAALINASGKYGVITYKGVTAQGYGPFEHNAPIEPAAKEIVDAGRPVAQVAQPDGPGTLVTVDGSGGYANPDVYGTGLQGHVLIDGERITYAMREGTGIIGHKDFYIKGEAPFIVVHEPGKITLTTTEGRRRIFQMPIPANIVPQHMLPPPDVLPIDQMRTQMSNWPWSVDVLVNGISRMNGWYAGVMAIGLDDGANEAIIRRYTNPSVWKTNAYTRLLPIAD